MANFLDTFTTAGLFALVEKVFTFTTGIALLFGGQPLAYDAQSQTANAASAIAQDASYPAIITSDDHVATSTIINQYITQPVIEHPVESNASAPVDEILTELRDFDSRLAALAAAQQDAPASLAGGGSLPYANAFGLSQRIDQLSGTAISNPTITGGSISGTAISGTLTNAINSAVAVITDLTTTDLVATNATTTNATTTNLYVAGTVNFAAPLSIASGGTGTSTAPAYGQLLLGNVLGGYDLVATSSLGITSGGIWGSITGTLSDQTDLQSALNAKLSLSSWYATTTSALPEGDNLYYTPARVASVIAGTTTDALTQGGTNKYWNNFLFDTRLSATTTLPGLTSTPNLATVGTITTGVWQGTAIGDAYLTKTGNWTGSFDGQAGTHYLARANHTGTQVASTISDFAVAADARINATSSIGTITAAPSLASLSSSLTGLLKASSGVLSAAAAGADYAPATAGTSMLVGNGSGGFTTYSGSSCTSQFIRSVNGAGVATCAAVSLTSDVTGVLPVVNGGTGWANIAVGFVPIGNGSTALATSSALYVDTATARVGVGTTSPEAKLHVIANTPNATSEGGPNGIQISGLSNNRSMWLGVDDAANVGFINAAQSGAIVPIALQTRGGNVGIGTANPGQLLSIGGPLANYASANLGILWNSAAGFQGITLQSSSVTFAGSPIVFANSSGGLSGFIAQNTNSVFYNTTSDRRLKENIATTTLGLDTLLKLPVRDFDFRTDPTHATSTGFIAQEVQTVFPWAVTTNGDDGNVPLGATSSPWSVDYGRITPLIVKAVQDIATLDGTFRAAFMAWYSDAGNGIGDFFAARLHTDELCVKDVCVNRDQLAALLAAQSSAPRSSTSSDPSTSDTTPPVITVNGDNSVHINTRETYADPGAMVTDTIDLNFGIHVVVDGMPKNQTVVDTSEPATHLIDYVAIDAAGNRATATRTVIVERSPPADMPQ